MTTLSTVLCLSISLAVDPSPPPIIKMCLGLTEKKYKPCYIVIAEPASRFMFARGDRERAVLVVVQEGWMNQGFMVNELVHFSTLQLSIKN